MPEAERPRRTPDHILRHRRRGARALAVAVAVLLATLGLPDVVSAAPPATPPHGHVAAPSLTPLVLDDVDPATTTGPVAPTDQADATTGATTGSVDAPATSASSFTAPPNTDFTLDFDGSVDAATRQVVTAAAGIWSATLATRVPITVNVTMQALAPGMLGAAGPTTAQFGQPSFPRPDVLYPVALANQFAGRDLDPGTADINLVLSSAMTWDKSIDGTVSPNGQSMLSVAIHEIGHGLGHTSWVRKSGSGWAVNYVIDGVTVALAYDRLVGTSSGAPITSLGTTALNQALTSPMHWLGAKGQAAAGASGPLLYSPSTFELGSSVGHLDEATYGTAVMTPFLGRGESHTSVPALTRAMLADTGWSLEPTTSTSTTSTSTPTSSSGTSSTTTPTPAPTAASLAEAFVDAVANDFLGRSATTQELTTWRDHLLAGGSRGDVTRSYAYSDEWIGVIVDGLYRSTLGRAPDAGGRAFWINVIRSGATPAEVASHFYASDEYFRRSGGTTDTWVRDLYAEILGRDVDADGLAFWVGRSAVVSRDAIAYDFYQSLESRRDRVADLFERLLGRAPDAGGWAYWAGILQDGRDVDLAVFLAASDEYFGRATSGVG